MKKITHQIRSLVPVRLKTFIKAILRSTLVALLQKRYNLVHRAQFEAERKFFCTPPDNIEKILAGTPIGVLDVGARGGIEDGMEKYRHLLSITLAEPDPKEAAQLEKQGYTVIKSLIGGKQGKAVLNIGYHGGTSSVLEPIGSFLEFYTSGNTKRFDVVDKVELPMTTIQAIMEKEPVQLDYLKLDTQGNELDILKGMGDFRPLIIKTEISFVPLYKDTCLFFDVGQFLYELGYILFHTTYYARSSPQKHISRNPFSETLIPTHGDAWFCPDWTRPEGRAMIESREAVYRALMEIFGMSAIYMYAKRKLDGRQNEHA